MNKKEKVILFGRGMVYVNKRDYIFDNYEVVLFLDNAVDEDIENIIDERTNISVVNPSKIVNAPAYPIILLSYALGDMSRQLLHLGVECGRIWFGPMLRPYNSFERMLFSDDGAELRLEEEKVLYYNKTLSLKLETNSSDLEELAFRLKDTVLFPTSEHMLKALDLQPLDDTYGMHRGTPVDRYYIEKFLSENKSYISGTVMEIGDRDYTMKYGNKKVTESIVIHVAKQDKSQNIIQGDLVSGRGLTENSVDCFICTQTLPFIYEIDLAAENIIKVLKSGGTALITVGGISQIIKYERENFGHYWSFTDMSLKRLFENNPLVESISVKTYGNVKTATAFLYGISYEELKKDELDYFDTNYQLIIAAVIKKVSDSK